MLLSIGFRRGRGRGATKARPAEGAHAALRAWHAEWVVRQHHVMLAVLQMYCAAVPQSDFPTELRGYMLLEGAAAAALRRQSLQAQVAAADFGVVLDTATVAEGLWLGRWIKQDADVARCALLSVRWARPVAVQAALGC